MIPQGLVLDVGRYLAALWRACQLEAAARGDGSSARLRLRVVGSLERLRPPGTAAKEQGEEDGEEEWRVEGPGPGVRVAAAGAAEAVEGVQYDAVVVAAGAAAATIVEVAAAALPLQLCQGLTLVMAPGPTAAPAAAPSPTAPPCAPDPAAASCVGGYPGGYPAGRPSLLGQPYLAAQGPGRLVVGATKRYGWSARQALEACMRSEYAAERTRAAEAAEVDATGPGAAPAAAAVADVAVDAMADAAATEALRAAACGVWAPLSGWEVARVREGVRALPPRTSAGSLPLLGRVAPGRSWWLVGGLGSRGLVYHGLLGRLAAEAALSGSEEGLPAELTAWRGVRVGEAVFEAP
ncbi:hypothetical protein GPECTOR_113g285 [Gonium pectorale]|uniref:FAD dependent oxidoreductase domain-containing protein n=1 Tax=Gonium pectorale TaxID=33097 RepID=A0A150FZ34_GONPE|nr:hypothetical protein GPECTOR_113g285 [Gonium pectorale]|eukprot:KXZ42873.1 hypothetical protein GPECTOR_113g285 [Gonium pectorale]